MIQNSVPVSFEGLEDNDVFVTVAAASEDAVDMTGPGIRLVLVAVELLLLLLVVVLLLPPLELGG